MAPNDHTIYTLQEVAERLRLPYRRVRDAVFAGDWPCMKVSARRRLMTGADVLAVIELLHAEPEPATPAAAARETRRNVRGLINAA